MPNNFNPAPDKANLVITHRTVYRYRQPIKLNDHTLMMRPRDGADLRIKSHQLTISPAAVIRYASDVQGNTLATAAFDAVSDFLIIEARTEIERVSAEWPVFNIDASAITYPFRYVETAFIDLGPLVTPQYPDLDGKLRDWALGFVRGRQTDTLSLLKDLSEGVSNALIYQVREGEGTQTPLKSLSLGQGTCRDYAVLFIEAARWLGFGGRIVSGYLHTAALDDALVAPPGATHAWAQVFLPGAGWITFDPTNRRMGEHNLIPVAVGTDIDRVMPVAGTFTGPVDSLTDMSVEITVLDVS